MRIVKIEEDSKNKPTYEKFSDMPKDLQQLILDVEKGVGVSHKKYKSFEEYLKDTGREHYVKD